MTNEVLKRLRDRRLNVWNDAKAIADRAAEENRALDADEERQWQEMTAELDALDRRMKAIADAEKRAAETEAKFAEIEGRPADKRDGQTDVESQRSAEFRAFLKGEKGAPRAIEIKPTGPVSFRDLSKLTAGAGANLVPTDFYGRLVAHLIETSGVLQAGPTVLRTESGESLQVPKTTAHSSAAIVTEGSPIAESDPAFGQTPLGAFKYGAIIQVTRELLDDSGVDLEGYLSMQAGRALGNAFGAHMVTGTGTGQPRGIVTDATVGVTGPVGTTTTFGSQGTVGMGGDLVISLYHSVIGPYRMRGASFLMNDTTASLVRRIKSTEGVYAWQESLVPGAPATLLGVPVYIDPNVASPAANAKSIVFGDFSSYFVRFAGGVRFERSDEFAFNSDLVTFRALLRADAALMDLTGAVKTFVHSAT